MSETNNSPSPGPVAKFLDIPESPLLTLNMITPEGWVVEIVQSNCDLDNIHLKDVSYCLSHIKRDESDYYQLLHVL
jgi:UDP-glucose:glycoprotein glucosyltransferase